MVRIVDCVIGLNETDMLEIRSAELSGAVDSIIVVESMKTHRGEANAPKFLDLAESMRAVGVDIVDYIIDDMPIVTENKTEVYWILENFHRNCIIRPLAKMGLDDGDIILISDIDEIPRGEYVRQLPDMLDGAEVVVFEQIMKKFFVNNASATCANNLSWRGTVACRYGRLKAVTPQGARLGDPFRQRAGCVGGVGEAREHERIIADAGWHFSSMGGASSFEIKHAAIVEGPGGSRFGTFDGRFGRHNHAAQRERYAEIYSAFLHDFAPDIIEVDVSDRASVQGLDLPECIKADPLKYEHLFYFKNPID